ncbi:TRAP transporter substrate-binding protein [Corticicoccus populi]|uniref:TRAP transporter substrate-binding protein n=1 Tax=Corticicoccus populi TaxID=1812821 RepID=A0ABW5WT83_9STAP
MSKIRNIVSVLLITAVLAACSSGGESGGEANGSTNEGAAGELITLRLSETQVDDYPDAVAIYEFADRVEELSEGSITIDVYTGGQLGDEVTTIEQTQTGIIDIGRANTGPISQFVDDFGIFSFPFLFDSREHLWNALDSSLRDTLFTSLEEQNLVGLAFYDAGARSFYTMDPVENLDDLRGKSIRVMQNDILIEAFNELGVSPTPLAASEVYSALQTGVVDGGENNINTYVADGHYEVAKNFTTSEHLRIPGLLFMSKQSWDSLSEDQQEIISQAALESEETQMDEFDKYTEESERTAEEAGNNIIELSDSDRAQFRENVQGLYDKYEETYGDMFTEIENAK